MTAGVRIDESDRFGPRDLDELAQFESPSWWWPRVPRWSSGPTGRTSTPQHLRPALHRVARLAVGVLPSCDACGVSLVTAGRVSTRVATDPMADRVDIHQYAVDEGPCLDAIRTGTALRVDSLAEERRWPRFVPRALEEGVVSTYSVPLKVRDQTVGALNLYSRSGTFGPEDESAAALFVSQAAVALANAQTYQRARNVIDQLNEALATRDVIGQAKGILMARDGCDVDEAFEVLRSMSQSRNRKVRDIAAEVIDSVANRDAAP